MADSPCNPDTTAGPAAAPQEGWIGEFYLHAFLSLIRADRRVERRELIWIKRFFERQRCPDLYPRLLELSKREAVDGDAFERLVALAAQRLPGAEKRRFVYNLAQLCEAKGEIDDEEYASILDIASRLGVEETEADAIITSVYNVNNTFLAIIGVLALGFILYVTRSVIVPFVIALFLAMIINKVESLVSRALHWHRFRWVNQVAAMVLILGALFGLVLAGFVSGKDIATRFPFYQDKFVAGAHGLQDWAAAQGVTWLAGAGLTEQLSQLPIAGTVGGFVSSLLSLIGNFFLVVVFTGFMVFSITSFEGVLQEMNEKISAYISIKAMVSALTGFGVYLICLAFGVDFALFWAIFAFLLNFIPSIGSIIATIPPILLAAVQLASPGSVIAFGALLVALQMGIGNVLEPRLMGSRLAVKPLAILLGLIFWGFLWGIPGMFLAAPLMALLRVLASYFNFSRSVERLLAAD